MAEPPAAHGRVVAALLTLAALLAASSAAGGDLAPVGTRAVLTVEYVYQSEGTRSEPERSSRWKRRRVTHLSVDLVAEPAARAPMLHTRADAEATLQRPATPEAQRALAAALARCDDDADCLAAAILELNEAGAGARYQRWQPQRQSGGYRVDESEHVDVNGVGSETRRTGKGDAPDPKQPGVPAAGIALVEVDALGASLALRLPAPLAPLPVAKVVTSKASAAGGPAEAVPEEVPFAPGVPNEALRLVVPLAGDWRSQSGEQVVRVGAGNEAGTLTARWRFSAR
jgi:hypothetical protein